MTTSARPIIPAARHADRLAAARASLSPARLDAMFIGVGADLRYLTGYAALPLERLTMVILRPDRDPVLLVPRLERAAAESGLRTTVEIRTWEETDDPYGIAVEGLGPSPSIALSDTMPAMHVLRLQAAAPGATSSLASAVLREQRMIKDGDEVAILRLAAQAADRVVAAVAAGRLLGRTEADVAREVRERLLAEGHDAPQFAIVGSGPHSASPHHDATDRVIRAGEPIVLDIGGTLDGYGLDVTRTLWVTGGDATCGPSQDFLDLYAVLCAAQAAATAAVRPGVSCATIDAAAREPIEAAGMGAAFFHRTGHGIGLEGHEDPYLVAGNDLALRPGMAFSVEPGIYFADRHGARIEDIVVCGDDGPIVLNEAPRALSIVAG